GEDLGGAADDRRARIDRGVAGEQADVLGTEGVAEPEEFLVGQGLDRRGVDAPHPPRHRVEVQRGGHQALPRSGRCVEDDVLAVEELENGLLLGRIEGDPPLGDEAYEALEDLGGIRGRAVSVGQESGELGSHRRLQQRRGLGYSPPGEVHPCPSRTSASSFCAWDSASCSWWCTGSPSSWAAPSAGRRSVRPCRISESISRPRPGDSLRPWRNSAEASSSSSASSLASPARAWPS